MAVTAVAPMYQWAETTSTARGRARLCPLRRQARVKPFSSSVFIGLTWPMNRAGVRVMGDAFTTEGRGARAQKRCRLVRRHLYPAGEVILNPSRWRRGEGQG